MEKQVLWVRSAEKAKHINKYLHIKYSAQFFNDTAHSKANIITIEGDQNHKAAFWFIDFKLVIKK